MGWNPAFHVQGNHVGRILVEKIMPNVDKKAAKMDEVRKTLLTMVHLHGCCVKWDGVNKAAIELEGTFNLEQLEALVWWMKEREVPKTG